MSYLTTPKQDPKAARTALEQGNAAYRSHDFTNAIKAYNRAIALDPTNAEAHFSRAMAFLRLGHTERALEGFGEAIRLNPRLAKAHYYQGQILRSQGERPRAQQLHRDAQCDPTHAPSYTIAG